MYHIDDTYLDFNTSDFEMLTGMPHHKLVPMRLRVTEYDYGNSMISSRFPRIFFEGETGGESWNEDAEEMGEVPDVRLITGNVSMLIDGNVRWSMVSRSRISSSYHAHIDHGNRIHIILETITQWNGFQRAYKLVGLARWPESWDCGQAARRWMTLLAGGGNGELLNMFPTRLLVIIPIYL